MGFCIYKHNDRHLLLVDERGVAGELIIKDPQPDITYNEGEHSIMLHWGGYNANGDFRNFTRNLSSETVGNALMMLQDRITKQRNSDGKAG